MLVTKELMELSGLSRTTLRDLVLAGIVRPTLRGRAGGRRSDKFSLPEAIIAVRLATLFEYGCRMGLLAHVAESLRRTATNDAQAALDGKIGPDTFGVFGAEVCESAKSRARCVVDLWQRKHAAEKREERKGNRPASRNANRAPTQAAG